MVVEAVESDGDHNHGRAISRATPSQFDRSDAVFSEIFSHKSRANDDLPEIGEKVKNRSVKIVH